MWSRVEVYNILFLSYVSRISRTFRSVSLFVFWVFRNVWQLYVVDQNTISKDHAVSTVDSISTGSVTSNLTRDHYSQHRARINVFLKRAKKLFPLFLQAKSCWLYCSQLIPHADLNQLASCKWNTGASWTHFCRIILYSVSVRYKCETLLCNYGKLSY